MLNVYFLAKQMFKFWDGSHNASKRVKFEAFVFPFGDGILYAKIDEHIETKYTNIEIHF